MPGQALLSKNKLPLLPLRTQLDQTYKDSITQYLGIPVSDKKYLGGRLLTLWEKDSACFVFLIKGQIECHLNWFTLLSALHIDSGH